MSILRVVGIVALGIVAAVSLAIVKAQAPSGTKTIRLTTVDPDAAIKAAAEGCGPRPRR